MRLSSRFALIEHEKQGEKREKSKNTEPGLAFLWSGAVVSSGCFEGKMGLYRLSRPAGAAPSQFVGHDRRDLLLGHLLNRRPTQHCARNIEGVA
jgi:hypothetical protein